MRKRKNTRASKSPRSDNRYQGHLSRAELERRRAAQQERYRAWMLDPPDGYLEMRKITQFVRNAPRAVTTLLSPQGKGWRPPGPYLAPWTLPEPLLRESKSTHVPNPCQDSKEARRASIINGGHGGRNGSTRYRKHSEC